MKFLAVLLLACIVFLSSFTGMVKPAELPAKRTCCHQAASKDACHQNKKQDKNNNCNGEGCTMMFFSCSICGFLVVEPLAVKPNLPGLVQKPVSLYKIGRLSAYHPDDWKPPKV